ncbi:MAG: Unknown protein [uncultured Sulfurovum sp.]|uniref:Uncharacterized protein n=1 Tax=uncultured Sulfurovum sp. TaxID=269237 RepID=A0A6S6SD20_9BACT|nr:MAG: Unknown protein [uncultured Sulfurovum sp.]
MKKMISTAAVLALLTTCGHANFQFGDVFKDLKEIQKDAQENFKFTNAFHNLKMAQEDTQSHFKFGDIFQDLK